MVRKLFKWAERHEEWFHIYEINFHLCFLPLTVSWNWLISFAGDETSVKLKGLTCSRSHLYTKVFHICQEDDRHDSFFVSGGHSVQQMNFICDWWFNFKCDETPTFSPECPVPHFFWSYT
ncbi:hypothetical protein CEXT_678591 [Caerostris extrusa]|uniref:Uncharacterized protein n=1 Tax=Caerostris extrusa TaxID=172846 RepID=A0AAV4UXJ9_CAEEX|nr:hypothetical protein CEXT_678591 [Caerostris extrusa]